MAKASRKKQTAPDVADYPQCKLVRILEDVISGNKNTYAKAGDTVGIIAEHGDVLLVVAGWKYVQDVKVMVQAGYTFPVLASLTTDAPVVKQVTKVEAAPEVKQRPSYGSPSGKKQKQSSLF